jgi:hypothetical protein
VVKPRGRSMREAVLEQCYLASQVAEFLACQGQSCVAEELLDLGKSDPIVVPQSCVAEELLDLGKSDPIVVPIVVPL